MYQSLDGESFRIHIDDIEVFYIQKDRQTSIPDIRASKDD